MHFFGTMGVLFFTIGFIASLYIGLEKLWALSHGTLAPLVVNSPYFYIALTMMIIGVQLFLAGFLGELISRSSHDRNNYFVEKTV